jgi:RNA polymerase subunit RPABC4/transcription elongation factor Spt4
MSACPACGKPRADDSAPCPNCGAVWGAQHVCPHCGGTTNIEAHELMIWRCGACGGPRVPVDAPIARSGKELPSLREARTLAAAAFGWKMAGIFTAIGSTIGVVIGLIALILSGVAAAIMGGLGLTAFALSMWFFAKGRATTAEVKGKVTEAWATVAEEVMRAQGREISAAELARLMRTDEARAEQILKQLSVTDRARIRVADDAQLLYSVRGTDVTTQAEAEWDAELQAQEEARGAKR